MLQKIMLIEDDKDLQDLLKESLAQETNAEVIIANNGHEALNLLDKQQVDFIISDFNMPKMTGLQMLAKLREKSIKTPVLMMTAYIDPNIVLGALTLEATDFVWKKKLSGKILADRLFQNMERLKHKPGSRQSELWAMKRFSQLSE